MERRDGWHQIPRSGARMLHDRVDLARVDRRLRESRGCGCDGQLRDSGLRRGIRSRSRNRCGARGRGSFGQLHLAIAGGLGITRGHAGSGLGGAAAGRSPCGNWLGRLRRGLASPALVRGDAQAHFLLPGTCGIGLAYKSCAQGSRFPSYAPSGPAIEPRTAVSVLDAPSMRHSRTLRSRKKGGYAEEDECTPFAQSGRGTRARFSTIRLLASARAARRASHPRQPVLLC